GNKITMIPLTPEQVKEDEIKIKEKIEKERKQENRLSKQPSQEKKETKVCMLLTSSLTGKYLDSSSQKHHFVSSFSHGECSKQSETKTILKAKTSSNKIFVKRPSFSLLIFAYILLIILIVAIFCRYIFDPGGK
ncbi:hypothetical protein VIGAN_05244500, partial [Vigna angularis var. angularis]